ncbi:hypothetical protein KIPB_016234, partial [Kipferlia bialata]
FFRDPQPPTSCNCWNVHVRDLEFPASYHAGIAIPIATASGSPDAPAHMHVFDALADLLHRSGFPKGVNPYDPNTDPYFLFSTPNSMFALFHFLGTPYNEFLRRYAAAFVGGAASVPSFPDAAGDIRKFSHAL